MLNQIHWMKVTLSMAQKLRQIYGLSILTPKSELLKEVNNNLISKSKKVLNHVTLFARTRYHLAYLASLNLILASHNLIISAIRLF